MQQTYKSNTTNPPAGEYKNDSSPHAMNLQRKADLINTYTLQRWHTLESHQLINDISKGVVTKNLVSFSRNDDDTWRKKYLLNYNLAGNNNPLLNIDTWGKKYLLIYNLAGTNNPLLNNNPNTQLHIHLNSTFTKSGLDLKNGNNYLLKYNFSEMSFFCPAILREMRTILETQRAFNGDYKY